MTMTPDEKKVRDLMVTVAKKLEAAATTAQRRDLLTTIRYAVGTLARAQYWKPEAGNDI